MNAERRRRTHPPTYLADHDERAGGYCTCADCYSSRVYAAGYVLRTGSWEYSWRGYNTSRIVPHKDGGTRYNVRPA